MIPRKIKGQTIFVTTSWKAAMEKVEKFWNEGLFITDFDYGNGAYVVVMSEVEGWSGQAIRHGSTFPQEKISELWNKGYYITNVTYDGDDWVIVMSGVDYCSSQTWFTRSKWSEFREKIEEQWEQDKIVTKLGCRIERSSNTYCAIMTEFKDCSPAQSRRYIEGRLTIQELEDMCQDGKYIVDIFDFDGGVFVVTASRTGWDTCKVCKSRDYDDLIDKIKKYWDKNYSITSITYYGGEWFVVMGHK